MWFNDGFDVPYKFQYSEDAPTYSNGITYLLRTSMPVNNDKSFLCDIQEAYVFVPLENR